MAALIGRFAARFFNQPSVLGELIMGVLLGNLLYLFGYELMIILRQGVACTEMAQMVMSGRSIEEAAAAVMGAQTGAAFLEIVQGPQG